MFIFGYGCEEKHMTWSFPMHHTRTEASHQLGDLTPDIKRPPLFTGLTDVVASSMRCFLYLQIVSGLNFAIQKHKTHSYLVMVLLSPVSTGDMSAWISSAMQQEWCSGYNLARYLAAML
ncbi:hypothetical protein DUI87_04688 [Hirundo rustica rustica]|uniref:Uncharacterized protein n=1 Tax=Hirundo rustica rustica TaxID=333673 RepID=A0A3M0KZR1_HIRRU|nr:hypothetical protein DUI87_04688 [Hirundo rustica rustica]